MMTKIKYDKTRRGYKMNIPKEMVLQLFGKENQDLDVELVMDAANQCIKIRNAQIPKDLPVQYRAMFAVESIKKKSEYNKKIAPKQYEKRMKDFHKNVKEKQIKNGSIENYRQLLKKDGVYKFSQEYDPKKDKKPRNSKLTKISKEQREKELDSLGRD